MQDSRRQTEIRQVTAQQLDPRLIEALAEFVGQSPQNLAAALPASLQPIVDGLTSRDELPLTTLGLSKTIRHLGSHLTGQSHVPGAAQQSAWSVLGIQETPDLTMQAISRYVSKATRRGWSRMGVGQRDFLPTPHAHIHDPASVTPYLCTEDALQTCCQPSHTIQVHMNVAAWLDQPCQH